MWSLLPPSLSSSEQQGMHGREAVNTACAGDGGTRGLALEVSFTEMLKVEEGGENSILHRCFIVIRTILPPVQPSPTKQYHSLVQFPYRTGKAS